MRIGLFAFNNYGRLYSYFLGDDVEVEPNTEYDVVTNDGTVYKCPLTFVEYGDEAPAGITLKTITSVEKVEEED